MVSLLRINEGNVIFCCKSLKKHNCGRLYYIIFCRKLYFLYFCGRI